MPKFELKAAKAAAAANKAVESGCHTARIVHVVDVGLVPGFGPDDEPRASHGFTFQLPDGRLVTKVMANSASAKSLMGQLVSCFDVDDLKHLVGLTLTLDLVGNGAWPKFAAMYPLDVGMSDPVTEWPETDLISLFPAGDAEVVDIKANQEAVKRLPIELRKALLANPKAGE